MDRADIEEMFAPFGRVTVKRMFSGFGVYVDDACFAIALRGGMFLKADADTKARFAAAGCQPFSYATKARAMTVQSFWTLPETALDDEDELREWCGLALEAARRTAANKAAQRARKVAREQNRAKGNRLL